MVSQPNIFYLCGFSGSSGSLIITPKRAWFFTDPRYTEVAVKQLPRQVQLVSLEKDNPTALNQFLKKVRINELNFEAHRLTVADREAWKKKLGRGIKLTEMQTPAVEILRQIKDRAEIKLIKQAGKITIEVWKNLKTIIKLGMTEKDIAWEIEKLARSLGADELAFVPIVAFSEHTAVPHHQNTERKLSKGDFIQLDFGVEVAGYKSDMSRIFFTDEPRVEIREIYLHVLEVQKMALADLKAGKKCSDLMLDYTPTTLTRQGDELVSHGLGHGVGLEIHELPNLKPAAKDTLQANQVVTVEPGYYQEDLGGVRIEDTVLVTKKGYKNLTPAPKTLRSAILYL